MTPACRPALHTLDCCRKETFYWHHLYCISKEFCQISDVNYARSTQHCKHKNSRALGRCSPKECNQCINVSYCYLVHKLFNLPWAQTGHVCTHHFIVHRPDYFSRSIEASSRTFISVHQCKSNHVNMICAFCACILSMLHLHSTYCTLFLCTDPEASCHRSLAGLKHVNTEVFEFSCRKQHVRTSGSDADDWFLKGLSRVKPSGDAAATLQE